jgi:hypothetical protein
MSTRTQTFSRRVRPVCAVAIVALVASYGTASLGTSATALAPVGGSAVALAEPAAVFADGFESGTLDAWSITSGLTPVATDAHAGSWSVQAAPDVDASFAMTNPSSPVRQGLAKVAFKVHDLTTRATLLKLRTADGSAITIGLNLRARPFVFMAGALTVSEAPLEVAPDVWHELSVTFDIATATTASVSIDGMVVEEVRTEGATEPVDRLAIGTRRDGRVYDIWFDDVSLTDLGDAPPEPDPSPVVGAAGDIACDPADPAFNGGLGTATACRMADTSDLLAAADVVLPLGDIQYEHGELELYARSYDPSWGRFLAVTKPVVGNHEYEQPGASAYFTYFGASAGAPGEGWYSFDIGSWHVVVLNSECTVVGCGAGSAQYAWLQQDLAASTATCTLAAWHRPRFSSGAHGGDQRTAPLWALLDTERAEVVLSGHDHHYERFAPQDASGVRVSTGMRQFVVGTGGKSLNQLDGVAANSQVRSDAAYGVLFLTLRAGAYDWSFEPVPGSSFTDRGSTACS